MLSSVEAEQKWGLKAGTVRSACSRGKLKKYIGTGVKNVDNRWILMDWVMEKEYGEEPKMKEILNVEFIEEFKTEGKENEAYVLAKVEFEDGSTKFEVSHEIDGIAGHTENEYFDSEDAARQYIEDNNF